MKYLLLIYGPDRGTLDPAQVEAEMPRWAQYTDDLQASGMLVAGEALQGVETATTVRVRDDETLVSDGPFAETRELLGGFYLVDAPDLQTAQAFAAKMPNMGRGSVEVRPLMEYPVAASTS